jgi:hypothetical protein
VAAEQIVAEAEETHAAHLMQKRVANAYYPSCGEPTCSTQPNTYVSTRGKPNFRCGRLWQPTKQALRHLITLSGCGTPSMR